MPHLPLPLRRTNPRGMTMVERRQAVGVTRRRAITVMAAFAGLPLMGKSGNAVAAASGVTFSHGVATWHGQALGAPAQLVLHHENDSEARQLIGRIVAEVARLEAIFSLYRDTSAVSELNRSGMLAAPPAELVALLHLCRDFHTMSNGAFDPTVQPLWHVYSRHFARGQDIADGPAVDAIEKARALVGFDKVRFNRDRVTFTRPGMALTLNGIAQGFITDRAVDILRQAGMTSSLVDMGEIRAAGPRSDGTPWRIGLAQAGNGNPEKVIDLVDKAVATSSASGFYFDAAGRFGHLLDPRNGSAATRYARMSVIAADATTADALSTAFSLMEPAAVRTVTKSRPTILADFALP